MSQTSDYKPNNDMDVMIDLDSIIEDYQLELHRAVAMSNLNVNVDDAFSESVKLVDKMHDMYNAIESSIVKEVALFKIKSVVDDFGEKLRQV